MVQLLVRMFGKPLVVVPLLLVLLPLSIAYAATFIVWPGNLGIWEIANFDNNDASITTGTTASGTFTDFVIGPATPPLGSGSLHLHMGTDGDDAARIRTSDYNGMALANLTTLSYSTYVTTPGSGGQAAYLNLFVDTSGDGNWDDILFFEPAYQNGTYSTLGYSGPIPNQCAQPACVQLGEWQTWDALIGGWWSLNESAGGPPLTTLAAYNTQHGGNVTFATDTPALRVLAGFGSGAWPNFDGNVDALTINSDIFDFELEAARAPRPPREDDNPNEDDEVVIQPPGQPALTSACGSLGALTNGAMMVNTSDPTVFCHVIAMDGQYVTNPGEIGDLNIINLGVWQAVNVFALLPGGVPSMTVSAPVNVCLRGAGAVYFRSAVDGTVSQPGASFSNGYTCVTLPGPGTVVLVGGAAAAPPSLPSDSAATNGETALTGCEVTTTNALRLREQANTSSRILTVVPFDTTLQADARADGWFHVVFGNQPGWLSGDFVDTRGNCGA